MKKTKVKSFEYKIHILQGESLFFTHEKFAA